MIYRQTVYLSENPTHKNIAADESVISMLFPVCVGKKEPTRSCMLYTQEKSMLSHEKSCYIFTRSVLSATN